jgi:hypothetical protein
LPSRRCAPRLPAALSPRPGPQRPHAHLLRGLVRQAARSHRGTGETLVQGLGPRGVVRRSRVEVILLSPLVTVGAVLARHLEEPLALALVERGQPDGERTIPVGTQSQTSSTSGDIAELRSHRVSPGGSMARSSSSVSAVSSPGRRLATVLVRQRWAAASVADGWGSHACGGEAGHPAQRACVNTGATDQPHLFGPLTGLRTEPLWPDPGRVR